MKKFNLSQKGSVMVEALAMLGLIAMVTPVLYRKSAERTTELQDINIASQIRMVSQAIDAYIKDNYSTLSGFTGVIASGNTHFENIKNYLPEGFDLDQSSKLFEDFRIGVAHTSFTDVHQHPHDVYTTAVVAPLIEDMTRARAAKIATMIGTNGGMVNSSGGTYQFNGTQGSWSTTPDNFGFNWGTNDPVRDNSLVSISTEAIHSAVGDVDSSEALYRISTGDPEKNTMHTPLIFADSATLNMAGHDIRGVTNIIQNNNSGITVSGNTTFANNITGRGTFTINNLLNAANNLVTITAGQGLRVNDDLQVDHDMQVGGAADITGRLTLHNVLDMKGGDIDHAGNIGAQQGNFIGIDSTNGYTGGPFKGSSVDTGSIKGTSLDVGTGDINGGSLKVSGIIRGDSLKIDNDITAGEKIVGHDLQINGTNFGIDNTGVITGAKLVLDHADIDGNGDAHVNSLTIRPGGYGGTNLASISSSGAISGASLNVGEGNIAGGSLSITGDAHIGGTLGVSGNTTLYGTLEVASGATIHSGLTVDNDNWTMNFNSNGLAVSSGDSSLTYNDNSFSVSMSDNKLQYNNDRLVIGGKNANATSDVSEMGNYSGNSVVITRNGIISLVAPGTNTSNEGATHGYIRARRLVSDISYPYAGIRGADNLGGAVNASGGDGNPYDTYQVNPAYTSVMNDIKLTSRGGARISDILPDFINKGIYVADNTVADLQFDWVDRDENGDWLNRVGPQKNVANPKNNPVYIQTGNIASCQSPKCITSPWLGFVPAPKCPPKYDKVITLEPFRWKMSEIYNVVKMSNMHESTDELQQIIPTQWPNMQGDSYIFDRYFLNYQNPIRSKNFEDEYDLTVDNNNRVVINNAPLIFQANTWLNTSMAEHTNDDDGQVKGWSVLMGFIYPLDKFNGDEDNPADYYYGDKDYAENTYFNLYHRLTGSTTLPDGQTKIGSDDTIWNLFPVRTQELAAVVRVYCAINRVDNDYGDDIYNYDSLNEFQTDPQGFWAHNMLSKNQDWSSNVNDPSLDYTDAW